MWNTYEIGLEVNITSLHVIDFIKVLALLFIGLGMNCSMFITLEKFKLNK